MVLQCIAIVSDLLEISLINRAEAQGITRSEADSNDDRQGAIAVVQLVMILVTGVVFLAWFRRAYRNLPALGASQLRTKPGWAIGSWFVPLLNLVRPKQMADDIWRASDPAAPPQLTWVWHEQPVDLIVHLWWGAWLIGGFLSQLFIRLPRNTIDEIRRSAWLGLGSDVFALIAAPLALVVVHAITQREHERYAMLQKIPASAPVPY